MYSEEQVYKVLASAGIAIVRNGPSDFVVFCPFHTNRRTPAGEVNHESGVFYCFSCKHVATLEDFVVACTDLTYFQVVRLIDKYKDSSSIVDQVVAILDQNRELPDFGEDKVAQLHQNALDSQRAIDYLGGRGITLASIKRFRLGYSIKQDMVTFPYMSPDGSKYIGVEGRSIVGKRFMTGGPKSETLFNLRDRIWSDSIHLTESVLDCIRLEQVGCPAVSSMGSNRGKTQVNLLSRYFNTVYVVQDNDTAENQFAGQVSAAKLLDKLGNRGIIVKPPEKYKDIGEMPDEEIKLLVARTNDILEGI